jgi:hypothetical protein
MRTAQARVGARRPVLETSSETSNSLHSPLAHGFDLRVHALGGKRLTVFLADAEGHDIAPGLPAAAVGRWAGIGRTARIYQPAQGRAYASAGFTRIGKYADQALAGSATDKVGGDAVRIGPRGARDDVLGGVGRQPARDRQPAPHIVGGQSIPGTQRNARNG